MVRLIDADALIKKWENVHCDDISFEMALIGATNDVKNAPTVDAVPVRHGKWITKSTGGEYFDCCSECGYIEWDAPSKYCPNCGARMRDE